MRARPGQAGGGKTGSAAQLKLRYGLPVLGCAALVALGGCGTVDSAGSAPIFASTPAASTPVPTTPVPTTPVPSSPDAAPTTPAVSATPSAAATSSPGRAAPAGPSTPPTPHHEGLQQGDHGAQVLALQKKLLAMGFWLSSADGSYGQTTEQAVMAFQKATGLARDGVAGPITLKAVQAAAIDLQPQTTSGHWFEIDKTRQLLLIVDDGTIRHIFNTSTGSNSPYVQGGVTYTATTPSGQFAVFRQVDALDPGPLGDLWRPKYFNGGIAIHGSPSIPGFPASHGCARLSNPAIDWIWSSNELPIGTHVTVY